MAQLIKLQDYISRYQINLTRYPTQFIQLKRVQWERVKEQWEKGEIIPQWNHIDPSKTEEKTHHPLSFMKKIFPLKKGKLEKSTMKVNEPKQWMFEKKILDEETTLFFEPNIIYQPQSIEELKRMFLDQFFHFQLKWASSTLNEKSYVDPKFFRDSFLKTLLQRLPDHYLVLYYPIFRIKKAPVELDIIILTPTECILITLIEAENKAVFIGNSERFWTKKVGKNDYKILNPLIQLNRMETIINSIFLKNGLHVPIHKTLVSRNGYIDYPGSAYNVQFIDKKNYSEWLNKLRRNASPMKKMEIQAAKALLHSIDTTSYHRDLRNVKIEDE